MLPFFQTVSVFDSNVGSWLLGKVQDTFSEKEPFQGALLSLYSSILLGDLPEDVKSTATSSLASMLQATLEFRSDKIEAVDLPWDALDKHINSSTDGQVWNRDRSDAELQLQGCILAAKHLTTASEVTEIDIARWAVKLRFAMEEETVSLYWRIYHNVDSTNNNKEFTTRYAATVSLMAFARALRTGNRPPRVDKMYLDIYLVLYDILNDDDEELRDIAASTASWLLSYSSVSPSGSVTLSSLTASELISNFIVENYSDSSPLCSKAIRYVTGQWPRINGSTLTTRLTPVSSVVSELMKESTILFEEEKQNLFLEEVREADVWSSGLRRLSKDAYTQHLVGSMHRWVSDGLACLAETTSSRDGLMGWASKPEMFSLGVRVIALAGVLVSKDFGGSTYLGEGREDLTQKLQTLLDCGKAASLHENWLVRIQGALEWA